MSISRDFTSVFEQHFRIEYTQCNPQGVLKLTELCALFQATAAQHAEMGGISFSDMQQNDQAWVLSRMRIEIAALPRWRDDITVCTWINDLENARSFRSLELRSEKGKMAGCHTFWASFNTQSRRPEPLKLPHEHFGKFPERMPTTEPASRLLIPENLSLIGTHGVRRSDLDMVAHVNNVKYIEWCLDFADEEMQSPSVIEMNFIRELVLGDVVEVLYAREDDSHLFCVRRDGKDCFSMRIK